MEIEITPLPPLPVAARLLEFGVTLARADQQLLMLDYDGTLAPFRVERMEAVPYPGVKEYLATLIATGTQVVLISGRMSKEVAALLGMTPAPEIWGCHGWERLAGGEYTRIPLAPKQEERIFKAGYTLKNEGFGSRLEFKHGSIALHWRGADEAEQRAIEIAGLRTFEPVSGPDLRLHRFDGGLELRATGRDKGLVVRELLQRIEPNTPAAYLGDDQTDEDAFRALAGRGLGVLVRSEPRDTAATIWLRPPEELLQFFDLWCKSTHQP